MALLFFCFRENRYVYYRNNQFSLKEKNYEN